jgi:hypothetical protein
MTGFERPWQYEMLPQGKTFMAQPVGGGAFH